MAAQDPHVDPAPLAEAMPPCGRDDRDLHRLLLAAHNPYVGPSPFAEGMTLYGRDIERRDLYRLLLNERIVLLYSPPSAGKTSLIQAGLMPLLRRDPALRFFSIVGLAEGAASAAGPRNRYVASLVAQVEQALAPEQRGHFDWNTSEASLRRYLDRLHDADKQDAQWLGEVLVLDHFEDVLLDPYDRQDKKAFFQELGQALTDRSRHALFSMSEHHIAELDEYLHWLPTGLTHRYRLGLLSPDQAKQAITGPATDQAKYEVYEALAVEVLTRKLREAAASPVASAGRTTTLSDWIEPVQLQIVCRRLWSMRFPSPTETANAPPAETARIISAADVERLSVESALEDYYADTVKEAALAAPSTTERDVREWVEDRLILPSGARGQALRADTAGRTLPEAATKVLLTENLIRLQMLGDSRWYELSHDRLVEPIRRSNEQWFAALAPLQRKAREWARQDRGDRMLLSWREFLGQWNWRRAHDRELLPEERDFWARSRRKVLNSATLPLLVLLVLVSIFLGVTKMEAKSARDRQQMLVKLGDAKEQALERSLDTALIDGARAAMEVHEHRPSALQRLVGKGDVRKTLDFAVRESLMSVLHTARDVRKVIIHDASRLSAVAVSPGSGNVLFAYGGTGGKVWLAGENGLLPNNNSAEVCEGTDVRSLAFNPKDGTLLAVGCEDGSVRIWSTTPWKERGRWDAHYKTDGKTRTWTNTVAFNSDGTALASGGYQDNKIRVMPLTPDGSPALTKPKAMELSGANGGIWTIAYSPERDALGRDVLGVGDGIANLFLCAAGPREDKCDLKRLQRGNQDLPAGRNDAVLALAFTKDGKCLATASFKGQVKLWDLSSARSPNDGLEVDMDEAHAYSLAFLERTDSRELAVGRSSRLRFSRLDGNACRVDRSAPAGPSRPGPLVGDEVTGLAFHEGLLAASTGMGYLALIDIDGGNDRILQHASGLPDVRASKELGWRGALASDGQFVIGREDDDRLFVVRLAKDGKPGVEGIVPSGQRGILRVTASAARSRVASLGKDGTVRLWTLGEQLAPDPSVQPCPKNVAGNPARSPSRILLSPDADFLACLYNEGILIANLANPAASTWEPWKREFSDGADEGPALEIAFSPDGRLFAAGGKRIRVWNVSSGKLALRETKLMRLSGLADKVSELAIATTRRGQALMIAGGRHGQVLVWNAQTGDLVEPQPRRAGSRPIRQMAFLQAEDLLAGADDHGEVTLWNTDDWAQQPVKLRSTAGPTDFLSFVSSGAFLVSGTDDLAIWDIDIDSLRRKVCDVLDGDVSKATSVRGADACERKPPPK